MAATLDKEHSKEYKKMRGDLKKKTDKLWGRDEMRNGVFVGSVRDGGRRDKTESYERKRDVRPRGGRRYDEEKRGKNVTARRGFEH